MLATSNKTVSDSHQLPANAPSTLPCFIKVMGVALAVIFMVGGAVTAGLFFPVLGYWAVGATALGLVIGGLILYACLNTRQPPPIKDTHQTSSQRTISVTGKVDPRLVQANPTPTSSDENSTRTISIKRTNTQNDIDGHTKAAQDKEPGGILPECDVRGPNTLLDSNHINYYFLHLARSYSQTPIFVTNIGELYTPESLPNDIDALLKAVHDKELKEPNGIPYDIPIYLNVNKGTHWVLVYINRSTRTVEYYNSLPSAGDTKLVNALCSITQSLSKKDSGTSYTFENRSASLQKDATSCGAWVCWFLECKLSNYEAGIAELSSTTSMQGYRNHISIVASKQKCNTPVPPPLHSFA